MSNPAASVTRIFRFGLQFSLSKSTRTCSAFQTKALYHSGIPKKRSSKLPYILARNYRNSPVKAMGALSPNDPSSYSRPELAVVRHVDLKLNVDFDKKVLSGAALLKFEALQEVDEVVLDVSSLNIKAVELENGTALKYKVDGHISNFGSRLTINLPQTMSPAEKKNTSKDLSRIYVLMVSRKAGTDKCTKMIQDGEDFLYKLVEPSSTQCKTKKTFVRAPVENSCCGLCECESAGNSDEESLRRPDSERTPSRSQIISNDSERPSYSRKSSFDTERRAYSQKDKISSNGRFGIRVQYTTEPSASALQWLEPSQTSGKQYPYLFSQCQPIHARSILPCQDTPSVKFTYEAEVTAVEPYTILMSALVKDRGSNKTSFHQPVPIPSYLLAIAVGVLEQRSIGPRTIVWAEKEEIDRSAWEFAETEHYIQAAEKLCGPYVWTQYDLLVLPPSFPYGGMENPCLTFVTPTLLAGDRSQADVIVHEIMHSWTGNLITNRNFEHFWLNEGFTVFLERKVGASLIADAAEGKRNRDFHSLLGLQELSEAVHEQFTPNDPLTRLVPNLNGVHPDDAFSRVPYEKGSLFLRYLEDLVGGPEVFDDFLRSYLNNFQRKSLDTDQFKAYLLGYFNGQPSADKLGQVDWDKWLYTPGMPPIIPNYDTSMTKAITALLAKIDQNAEFSADDVKNFTPHQIINFLQEMVDRKPLPANRLEALGASYKIAESTNSEIRYRWLRLCVKSKIRARIPEVLQFVNSQGRMKYVRPLYRDMYAWEEVREEAVKNFLDNEHNMMHVSAYTIRKDLHLSENLLAQQ